MATANQGPRFAYIGSTVVFRVFIERHDRRERVSPSSGVTMTSMILHGGSEILTSSLDYVEDNPGEYSLSFETASLDPGTYTCRILIVGDEGTVIEQDRFVLRATGPTANEASVVPLKVSRDIHSGVGDPISLLGKDGDFYIKADGSGLEFYGPKTSSGWGSPVAVDNNGGGGGGGSESFEYTQATPETVWIINHGLSFNPNVAVVDSGGQVVMPTIDYATSNQVIVTHTGPMSGSAYLS